MEKQVTTGKKTMIFHFRSAPAEWSMDGIRGLVIGSAGTDGVSLEMRKRKAVLEAMGNEVVIVSAFDWADYNIPSLEYESEEVRLIRERLFGREAEKPKKLSGEEEAELRREFRRGVEDMRKEILRQIADYHPDNLFVHNILSLPVHPVATVAFVEVLKETGLLCSAMHHDILSEGALKFNQTCSFAEEIIRDYFPPVLPNLRHYTINTRNKTFLEREKGIKAEVIHDTMDFYKEHDLGRAERIRKHLRKMYDIKPNDIVLFSGARVVTNKQLVIAGQLAAALQRKRDKIIGRKLYNGQIFTDESNIVLVIAGRPEEESREYYVELLEVYTELGIKFVYAGDITRPVTVEEYGLYALHPDMYAMSDFVVYPTGWEGFGNQLLEAFESPNGARYSDGTYIRGMPVSVFEYDVFKEDIKPKGVEVVSLGDRVQSFSKEHPRLKRIPDKVTERAVERIISILTDEAEYRRISEKNLEISRKLFDFRVLRDHLKEALFGD